MTPSMEEVVQAYPFPQHQRWWPVGTQFTNFMSNAIVGEWSALPTNSGSLVPVAAYADQYVRTVYGRTLEERICTAFHTNTLARPLQSGGSEGVRTLG